MSNPLTPSRSYGQPGPGPRVSPPGLPGRLPFGQLPLPRARAYTSTSIRQHPPVRSVTHGGKILPSAEFPNWAPTDRQDEDQSSVTPIRSRAATMASQDSPVVPAAGSGAKWPSASYSSTIPNRPTIYHHHLSSEAWRRSESSGQHTQHTASVSASPSSVQHPSALVSNSPFKVGGVAPLPRRPSASAFQPDENAGNAKQHQQHESSSDGSARSAIQWTIPEEHEHVQDRYPGFDRGETALLSSPRVSDSELSLPLVYRMPNGRFPEPGLEVPTVSRAYPGRFMIDSPTPLPEVYRSPYSQYQDPSFRPSRLLSEAESALNNAIRAQQTANALAMSGLYEDLSGYDHIEDNIDFNNRDLVYDRSDERFRSNPPKDNSDYDDPRLSQFAWSPVEDTPVFDPALEMLPAISFASNYPYATTAPPGQAPLSPLPPAPSMNFGSRECSRRDSSLVAGEQSNSSQSYGNTRKLLGLGSPARPGKGVSSQASTQQQTLLDALVPGRLNLERLFQGGSSEESRAGFLPMSEGLNHGASRDTSDQSFARVSLISPKGAIKSRNLSEVEMRTLEQQISDELRRESAFSINERIPDPATDPFFELKPGGLLRIEHNYRYDENSMVDVGPKGSRMTINKDHDNESMQSVQHIKPAKRAGMLDRLRTRKGKQVARQSTPPLLFSRSDAIEHAGGHSTQARQKSEYGMALSGEQTGGQDWVTEADSQQTSSIAVPTNVAQAGSKSSLGERDVSRRLSRYQPSALAPVLQHPAHPRYLHAYNLFKDRTSGKVISIPKTPFNNASGFPNLDDFTTNMMINRILDNPYQHPSPMSTKHVHPFNSSPPQLSPEESKSNFASRSVENAGPYSHSESFETERDVTYHDKRESIASNPFRSNRSKRANREMVFAPGDNPFGSDPFGSDKEVRMGANKDPLTSFDSDEIIRSSDSGAWQSTADGATSKDSAFERAHGGTSSKVAVLGSRGNVLGMFNGHGVHQDGGSLAGVSGSSDMRHFSPQHFASSPYNQLSPLEEKCRKTINAPAKSKSAKMVHRRMIDGSADSNVVHEPGSLYENIRKMNITKDSELFEDVSPGPSTQSNYVSAELNAHRQALIEDGLLPQTPITPLEPRHNSGPLETFEIEEPDFTGKDKGTITPSQKRRQSGHYFNNLAEGIQGVRSRVRSPKRRHQERQASMELRSPNHYNETAPLTSPADSDNGKARDVKKERRIRFESKAQVFQDFDPRNHPSQKSLQSWVESRAPTDAESFSRRQRSAAYQMLTDDSSAGVNRVIRATRPPRPTSGSTSGRPIARRESPHLFSIPRQNSAAIRARQRDFSILVLCACCLFPPLLPLLGHGYMDTIISCYSYGEITTYRRREMMSALVIGYTFLGATVLGIVLYTLSAHGVI